MTVNPADNTQDNTKAASAPDCANGASSTPDASGHASAAGQPDPNAPSIRELDRKASLLDRIQNDFTYHAPRPDQVVTYNHIREAGYEFARLLVHVVPEGRELSTALTMLEGAVMHANAGIARHG